MLTQDFFERDLLTVARELIGVELVWHGCSGIIVETEAYAQEGDAACHTATRPSAREFVRVMPAGSAYVYFNYGMYWLFNLLVKGGRQDGLILIRALEPREGLERMQQRRGRQNPRELCSGPGKLAMALGIAGENHGTPMAGPHRPEGVGLRLPEVPLSAGHLVASDIRVGISKAVDFQWRFLAAGHTHVSVPHGRVKVSGTSIRTAKRSGKKPGKKKPPVRRRVQNGG